MEKVNNENNEANEVKSRPRGRPRKYPEQPSTVNGDAARPRGRPRKFNSLEEQRATKRQYYQDNKEVIHERMNEYYERNKPRIREQYNKRQAHYKFLQEFYDTWKDKVNNVK